MPNDNVRELPVTGPPPGSGLATCRFCGQTKVVDLDVFPDPTAADEHVSRECGCHGAYEYRQELEREQSLERAKKQIEDLFGKGAPGYGLLSAIDEVKEVLFEAARLVYDFKIKDLTVSISPCVKAKVSRSAKGKIVLNRSDVAAFKQEV